MFYYKIDLVSARIRPRCKHKFYISNIELDCWKRLLKFMSDDEWHTISQIKDGAHYIQKLWLFVVLGILEYKFWFVSNYRPQAILFRLTKHSKEFIKYLSRLETAHVKKAFEKSNNN